MWEVEAGVKVYAYEVDGLGNKLTDFDDPNSERGGAGRCLLRLLLCGVGVPASACFDQRRVFLAIGLLACGRLQLVVGCLLRLRGLFIFSSRRLI